MFDATEARCLTDKMFDKKLERVLKKIRSSANKGKNILFITYTEFEEGLYLTISTRLNEIGFESRRCRDYGEYYLRVEW